MEVIYLTIAGVSSFASLIVGLYAIYLRRQARGQHLAEPAIQVAR